MDFQVMSEGYYDRMLSRIQKHVPEFKSLFDEEDGIYPVLGELGSFLVDSLRNAIVINNVAHFVNEALEEGKSDTEDAIVVQIFQRLYQMNDYSSFRVLLSEKGGIFLTNICNYITEDTNMLRH